jgi:predicted ArsR family transcriptional regulator
MVRHTQRERVQAYLARRKTPATRSEIAQATRITYPSACRRVDELLRDGSARIAGHRGQTQVIESV